MEEGIDEALEPPAAKGMFWDILFYPCKQPSHTTSANLFLLDPHSEVRLEKLALELVKIPGP